MTALSMVSDPEWNTRSTPKAKVVEVVVVTVTWRHARRLRPD